jgi:hypothetical protein
MTTVLYGMSLIQKSPSFLWCDHANSTEASQNRKKRRRRRRRGGKRRRTQTVVRIAAFQ